MMTDEQKGVRYAISEVEQMLFFTRMLKGAGPLSDAPPSDADARCKGVFIGVVYRTALDLCDRGARPEHLKRLIEITWATIT